MSLCNLLKLLGLDRSKRYAYNLRMKIGYARVSTDDQNLALQLDALRKAGCDEVFEDQGVSGASTKRPGLSMALGALAEGDTLVVWRIDRLGRSTIDLLNTLDHLRSRTIGFLSIMDGIDTSTPAGRMGYTMIGSMAEFERSINAERTKAGLDAARRRGKRLGRPQKLPPGMIDYARKRIADGEGKAIVAADMGVGVSTLRRLLNEKAAAGQ